jgi:hypothetical protein
MMLEAIIVKFVVQREKKSLMRTEGSKATGERARKIKFHF